MGRARLVGINHIALEVGDIDAALEFYGRLLDFELRGRVGSRMAFLDLSKGRTQPADGARHFGLVVDDRAAFRRSLEQAGVEIIGGGLDFRDPWGNRIQVVQYDEIQFTKTSGVLRAMGLDGLGKTPEAEEELRRKGVGGD
jgi:predicted enzyme related to lactoylglutathione lyase